MPDAAQDLSAISAALDRWLESHAYASWDPYDALTSPFLHWTLGVPILARASMQAVKRSPLNLRPILGIRPAVYTKSLSDLASAHARRARTAQAGPRRQEEAAAAHRFLARLGERRLAGPGSAWGMDLPYVSRFVAAKATTPNLYQTVNAAAAFLDVYEMQAAAGAAAHAHLEIALCVSEFLEEGLGRLEQTADQIAWRYYPGQDACVYNVNALAGALLLRLGQTARRGDLAELGRRTLRFVAAAQNEDGSWYYSRESGGHWVDGFHTGFVLDSLLFAVREANELEFETAFDRGVRFYLERMFTSEHLPRYDARSTYPIEVQNCAQAVQTLARLAQHDRANLPRARATAQAVVSSLFRWTRREPSSEGYFLLARGPRLVNALPAVRWGQAPMLLALAQLEAAGAASS